MDAGTIESTKQSEKTWKWQTWMGMLGLSILLVTIGVLWSVKMASVMSDAAKGDANAAQVKVGEQTKMVLEILEVSADGKIHGTVLKEKTKEVYTRTDAKMIATENKETKFVMGKAEDVHAGAVVHVTGTMQEDRSLAAQQIVILTGVVRVE